MSSFYYSKIFVFLKKSRFSASLIENKKKSMGDEESYDKWIPVTTAWCILWLRMEERILMWRVDANILNKQSRKAEKKRSSSLGFGCGANNSTP